MRKFLFLPILILVIGCSRNAEISIIPQPTKVESLGGTIDFKSISSVVTKDSSFMDAATFVSSTLSSFIGNKLSVDTTIDNGQNNTISIYKSIDIPTEGYNLDISKDYGIKISASDYSGVIHGMYTIMQLLPENLYSNLYNPDSIVTAENLALPICHIEDAPHFSYRGLHLDVSRHFFNKDEVKRYIDIIAMHKLNRFHWHLTDSQGWRIEIKKYPLLTSISAWRASRIGCPWDNCKASEDDEEQNYGGYYTQEDVKEIVKYASERGVQIIPEIEMPGHSAAVFAAYPSLACSQKEQYVPTGGGEGGSKSPSEVFCAGRDESFEFLENVLKEVIEMFPDAPYIHIGGDEVNKQAWRNCPVCQKRIRDEHLKDEDELQSYFIKRMEKIINSMGKSIIGWDEILEGGIAPNATIMSWRGISGGITAAKAHHNVIMTPGKFLYFDHYQDNPENEPQAIGGYVTTKTVYDYNPIPEELQNTEEVKYILGAQANLWCEYIETFKHVEYMALPRTAALSEITWTAKESRDWENFKIRLAKHMNRLYAAGFNCHHGATDIDFSTNYNDKEKKFYISLESQIYDADIRYTLDKSTPTNQSKLFSKPFSIDENTTVTALAFKDGKVLSKVPTIRKIGFHKALGKKVEYKSQYSSEYPGSGDKTLVDGLGGPIDIASKFLQGFCDEDFEVTIDLEESTELTSVEADFIQSLGSWVYVPTALKVFVSEDGENFSEAGSIEKNIDAKSNPSCRIEYIVPLNTKGRYVKILGINGIPPKGMPGAGKKNWLFTDEIIIN